MKNSTTSSTIRYINDNQAQVTKAFAKKAMIFGTEEFNLWREYKKVFPDAVMECKTIKKAVNKNTTTKNMTYENMKLYILHQDDKKKAAKEFGEFVTEIQRSKVKANPYRAVLAWFIKKYGYINDYMDFFAEQAEEAKKVAEANVFELAQIVDFPTEKSEVANVAHGA